MRAETNPALDEQMAREAQAGSLSSFEELVRRYEGRIYCFVMGRCRDAADAQEVTQDVFVAAYRAIGRFDLNRSFATWLFTIARRKCIDYSRARRPVADEVLPEHAEGKDPSVVLAQREAEEDLWVLARRVMSGAQFDALWLRYAEDLEVAEVARVMNRTRTHIKVLLFRARLRLERELQGQNAGLRSAREREVKRTAVCAPTPSVFRPVSGGEV